MHVEHPEQRLAGFWGLVDRKHNAAIRERIEAGPVLDVGCGYGTLTAQLTREGLECTGIDLDSVSLAVARERCPECSFVESAASDLPFDDGEFATVVLRDALHHLVNEPSWPAIAGELLRVLRPDGRVVVLDPNITPILRLGRALARHEDEVCTVTRARSELESLGLSVTEPDFNTIFSLPLSGGYVGRPLVPGWSWLHRWLLAVEAGLERLLRRVGLLRRVAWRYILVACR
jgi:SAM-dependent methyltransferase